MKITVCKEVKYKPSGITSICSTNETIIAFRKNNTMEHIRNTTYQAYLYRELECSVVQSTIFLDDLCLVLGEDGCLRVIDLVSSEVNKLNTEYSIVCFESGFKGNAPFYCFTKNGLLVALDLRDIKEKIQSKIIQKCSRPVTCILKKEIVLLGDDKGRITSLNLNGGILNELELSNGSINCLHHISEDKYVALTGIGELIYFDIKLSSVLQKVKVREHSLTCGVYLDDCLHLSGVDSRIICYRMVKNSFQKSYQADKHVMGVTSMCTIENSIFTGGLDGIMGIFVPKETRYCSFRIFDSTPSGKFVNKGINNNLVMINNVDFAEIFKLDKCHKNRNTLDTQYKTSIRLDQVYLQDLSVKEVKFTNECRICFENKVYYCDTDGKILVYSDKESTRLIELSPKVQHDSYFKFPPSKYIFISPTVIVLQLTEMKVKIIDRNDYGKVGELEYSDIDEEIKVIDDLIVFKKSKKVYNLVNKLEDTNMLSDVEGIIIDALKVNNDVVILAKKDMTRHIFYRKGPKGDTSFYFATYDILTGIIKHNQDVFYTTVSSITNVKNGSTYDLGSIVYSSGSLGTSMVAVKDDWAYLQNELGEKIVKTRWKSR